MKAALAGVVDKAGGRGLASLTTPAGDAAGGKRGDLADAPRRLDDDTAGWTTTAGTGFGGRNRRAASASTTTSSATEAPDSARAFVAAAARRLDTRVGGPGGAERDLAGIAPRLDGATVAWASCCEVTAPGAGVDGSDRRPAFAFTASSLATKTPSSARAFVDTAARRLDTRVGGPGGAARDLAGAALRLDDDTVDLTTTAETGVGGRDTCDAVASTAPSLVTTASGSARGVVATAGSVTRMDKPTGAL